MTTPLDWLAVDPSLAPQLGDSRLLLHHAAQMAATFGISYLKHEADDSHTNLEWLADHRALASKPLGTTRVAIRVPDLTLLVLHDHELSSSFALEHRTIADAASWLRTALDQAGVDGGRYSLNRHYEIPAHPVMHGESFSADTSHLEQLARWFGNAAAALESIRSTTDGSPVRCWPHRFDIATLITVHAGATVGAGMEPGDSYYNEPYFYVNASPQPPISTLSGALDGGGRWHTSEWIGAVLPGSLITGSGGRQQAQAGAFLDSAVRSLRSLAA